MISRLSNFNLKLTAALLFLATPLHAADVAISALPAAGTIAGADIFPCVQSGTTNKCTVTGLNTVLQPLDADLTSWAGVTRGSGFDTFTATPSYANLASLMTDESFALLGAANVFTALNEFDLSIAFDDSDGIKSSEASNPSLLLFTSVTSAVNYLTLTNAATGNPVRLGAAEGINLHPDGDSAEAMFVNITSFYEEPDPIGDPGIYRGYVQFTAPDQETCAPSNPCDDVERNGFRFLVGDAGGDDGEFTVALENNPDIKVEVALDPNDGSIEFSLRDEADVGFGFGLGNDSQGSFTYSGPGDESLNFEAENTDDITFETDTEGDGGLALTISGATQVVDFAETPTKDSKAIKFAGEQVITMLAGSASLPSGGAVAACGMQAALDSGSNDVFYRACNTIAATDTGMYFLIKPPKSADESVDLQAVINWIGDTATDATDDVIFAMACVSFGDGDDVNANAFPTVDTVTDTSVGAQRAQSTARVTALTPAGTWAEGDSLVCRVTRDADAGGDNYNGGAFITSVQFFYQDNAANEN